VLLWCELVLVALNLRQWYYTTMLKKSQAKFIIYSVIIFLVLFALLYTAGLVPDSIKKNEGDSLGTLWDKAQQKAIEDQLKQGLPTIISPTRIVIDKIGVDALVSNPNTTNVSTLDDYLAQGAVRYPGSGLIGRGNMFIFGHSTGLAVVRNQAYKTFNGLKNLQVGDIIKVYGSSGVYTYQVTSVTLVDASQALVELGGDKNMLTLSTCNTFGQKQERYVVTASFIK
jgi:LPXTG-site transpeptidase (sortase) family protein